MRLRLGKWRRISYLCVLAEVELIFKVARLNCLLEGQLIDVKSSLKQSFSLSASLFEA